jgi:hypothetical protein
MYFVRGTVSAKVADASGGTEELKKRYNNVDTVLRNGNDYYFCDTVHDAEFTDIK